MSKNIDIANSGRTIINKAGRAKYRIAGLA